MKLAVALLLCAVVGVAVASQWGNNDRGRGNGPYGGGNGGGYHKSKSSSGSHGHSDSSSEESKEGKKPCREQFFCTKDPKYSLPIAGGGSIARDCKFAITGTPAEKKTFCGICCDGFGLSQGISTDKIHGSVEADTSCVCCQLACPRRFPGFP